MAAHCSEKTIALPRGWTKRVKSALIQSVSLAATALNLAHGRASSSSRPRKRMAAAPQAQISSRRGAELTLVVGYLECRKYLPVVELRRAA